jgi:hypothetical protein
MSILNKLTEGIVERDLSRESHALLTKWERTGLLEGLTDDRNRNAMARLLENQAKELLRESSSMAVGDVEGFAAVAFPIVRRVFAGLIANELVSVQPMSLPSGLIFFLDFKFSPNLDASGTRNDGQFGQTSDRSIYGTDRVGSQITGGVNLVDTAGGDLSGPRTTVGYAYGSPSGSAFLSRGLGLSAGAHVRAAFALNSATEAQKKLIQYDPDLLALSGSSVAHSVAIISVAKAVLTSSNGSEADFNNLGAFSLHKLEAIAGVGESASVVRRLTRPQDSSETGSDRILFTIAGTAASGSGGVVVASVPSSGSVAATAKALATSQLTVRFPIRDNLTASDALGSVIGTTDWGLENEASIPEIDIQVDSIAVTAQTKKLKAKWTPELGQDLNAYHNLDAEVELTSILSEQIALEIDREILADLIRGATAATYYWARSPGMFLNRETGLEVGASSAAPDFTGTVSEWYETLVETINDVSAQIHRKTLRGGANFIVCSPEVANILEFTAGFRASVTADDERGSVGAVKVGALSKKFDVHVDPYFPRQVVLVGRRGGSFLESGYVYAPYVPLQVTPTIFGPEDFVPRKGVMTRYAKKMVRPDMYGLVICRGIVGESGATS